MSASLGVERGRARQSVRQLPAALFLAFGLSAGMPVMAEDAFVCMDESQERCDYENRNMELFIKGRDAFDQGRDSGDLSEARSYAAELMARNDMRHGKGLMKYVYLQFAQGTHRNLVEAHRWVAADIVAGVTYPRMDLERLLRQIEGRMTPDQLQEARK
jgi:hypothetical protein